MVSVVNPATISHLFKKIWLATGRWGYGLFVTKVENRGL